MTAVDSVSAEVWVMIYVEAARYKARTKWTERNAGVRLPLCGKCSRKIAKAGAPFPAMCRCGLSRSHRKSID